MLSCCCLSRQTSVVKRRGSFVVSVNKSCTSVEKFVSVSLYAFPRSQLFDSSALTQGAWPIFVLDAFDAHVLRPNLFRDFENRWCWSVPDPISPSSNGKQTLFTFFLHMKLRIFDEKSNNFLF